MNRIYKVRLDFAGTAMLTVMAKDETEAAELAKAMQLDCLIWDTQDWSTEVKEETNG